MYHNLFQQSTECYLHHFVVEVLNLGSRNSIWKPLPMVHTWAQGIFSRERQGSQANQILGSVIQKGLRVKHCSAISLSITDCLLLLHRKNPKHLQRNLLSKCKESQWHFLSFYLQCLLCPPSSPSHTQPIILHLLPNKQAPLHLYPHAFH